MQISSAEERRRTGFEDAQFGETEYENKYYLVSGENAEIKPNIINSGIKSYGGNESAYYNLTFTYVEGEQLISFSGWFFTYENDKEFIFDWKNETDAILRFTLNNTAINVSYNNSCDVIYFDSKSTGDWKFFGWEKISDNKSRYYTDNYLNGNSTNGTNYGGFFSRITNCDVSNDELGSLYFDDFEYFRSGISRQPNSVYNPMGIGIRINISYTEKQPIFLYNTLGSHIKIIDSGSSEQPRIKWNTIGSDIYIHHPYNESKVSETWTTVGGEINIYNFLQFDNEQPENNSINQKRNGKFSIYAHKTGNKTAYDFSFLVNNTHDESWIQYGETFNDVQTNATIHQYYPEWGYNETIWWRVKATNETLSLVEYSDIYHFTTKSFEYNESMNETWNSIGANIKVGYIYEEKEPVETWNSLGSLITIGPKPPSEEPVETWNSIGADIYVNYTYEDKEKKNQWNTIGANIFITKTYDDSMNKAWNSLGAGIKISYVYNQSFPNETWNSIGADIEIQSIPMISNLSIPNGSMNVDINISYWNATLKSPDEPFNWTIETQPDIGNSSANNDTNGTKSCPISSLNQNTEYMVYVNFSGIQKYFTFRTAGTNNIPNYPSSVIPSNNTYSTVYSVELSFFASDPQGNTMTVHFYWGNDTKIDTLSNVANNTKANTTLDNWLSHDSNHSWYVIIDDGEQMRNTSKSGDFWFITSKAWDLNEDKIINYLDISTAVAHYLHSCNPGSEPWDVNNDGIDNYLDLSSVVSHYLDSY